MMNIAIVDDEISESQNFLSISKKWAESRGIHVNFSCFTNGEEFLSEYKKEQYQIVFLDIYMNGISGIELAKKLKEEKPNCLLVFLTSSEEHMSEAFELHMFDYIIKPGSGERIFKVLDDAMKILPQKNRFVMVPCGRKNEKIYLNDVVCCVTDGHYVNISKSDNSTQRLRITISELFGALADKRFLIINQGIAVNMDFVLSLNCYTCVMKGDISFPVWRKKQLQVNKTYIDYIFNKMHSEQELVP